MANGFPSPPGKFVGRDDYIARFRARVEHFPFFVYEGIAGIGKTALVLRLIREAKPVGITTALYLPLWPGEAIASILARVEARFKKGGGSGAGEKHGDPYARLCEELDEHKCGLVLDGVHKMRREDLAPLVRAARAKPGKYRILAAARGEPELSAMDRASLHLERVGPLTADEVPKIAAAFKVKGAALEQIKEDAQRGGSVCHPLTLNYLLSLSSEALPAKEIMEKQSARSVNAFKAVMQEIAAKLGPDEREALASLSLVGLAIGKSVAVKAFGSVVDRLVRDRLVDVIEGDVYVHNLVTQVVGTEVQLGAGAARGVAAYLKERAEKRGEPLAMIRAAELLANAGVAENAVDTLATGWEAVRDVGFLEAYLKTLASVKASGPLDARARMLSAQARMRKGDPTGVQAEMESLSGERDVWTRTRAWAALTYIYNYKHEPKKVLEAYEQLRKTTQAADILTPAGIMAAGAMVRLGKVEDAEKLAQQLLSKLRGDQELERQGELHRLLARIFAQSGRLEEAVKEALEAAGAFERAGDLYHAATAQGYVGDLYRETGDFELAKKAFERFLNLARAWGDRDLVQIAELAEAWVSLDIGDMTHAAQRIAAVEKELSAAPSRRLRRYLAAARALLEAGRGRHKEAASMLSRVVEAWDQSSQRNIADVLRAQQVRSLLASGEIEHAEKIVKDTLARLDPATAAPRVAIFLREGGIIKLRRKDHKRAMEELAQARKLFAKGGNRREEAMTLHRIAHAALEEGDLDVAQERADEALALARKIKHTRAIALARELVGRIALERDDADEAVTAIRESQQALRKLGDDIGLLHVSESLLRAYILAGDLAAAIRLGPKVRDHAERLSIQEIRIRAIILTGVALLRRGRVDSATKCFRAMPEGVVTPLTTAMMWRLGEGIASFQGNRNEILSRRRHWAKAVKGMPEARRAHAIHVLEQLALPPRDRCALRTKDGVQLVGTEQIGLIDQSEYQLFVDVLNGYILVEGQSVEIGSPQLAALFTRLVTRTPDVVSFETIHTEMFGVAGEKAEKALRPYVRDLKKILKKAKDVDIALQNGGMKLVTPKSYAVLVPTFMSGGDLSDRQRKILQMLGRIGTAPIQTIQEKFSLTRAAARRDVSDLVRAHLVETVRDGRGQAFRLA
jgi:tetratricopeptide (TPR) repeat protein